MVEEQTLAKRDKININPDGYYWIRAKDDVYESDWEVVLRQLNRLYRPGYKSPLFLSDVREWGPKVEPPITMRLRKRAEKKRMDEFVELAKEAGFSIEQAEFMYEHLAKRPHTHQAEEILGLDEIIQESIDEAIQGEDDEEE